MRSFGFTLTECLITVIIMAILIMTVVPTLTQMLHKSQATSAVYNLVALLKTARTQAILRAQTLTVCPSTDATTCTTNWNHPLILLSASQVIATLPAVTKTATRAFNHGQQIHFLANGQTATSNGTFTYRFSTSNPATVYRIVINRTGRIIMLKPTN